METNLTFPSGDLELDATLATADAAKPSPAALLISGSGPLDRDSNTKRLRIDVMGQVARHLSANGIASLRYDKRGIGKSSGDYLLAGFFDNVADARAALVALRSRPEVDADQVVVVGHSEGALIASVLAADEALAGVVLLAGAARKGKEVLLWQARQIAPTIPKPAQWLMKLLRQDLLRTQAKRLQRIETSTEDVIRVQFVKLNAKWFREFMDFDPATALTLATVPVLALTGAKDIQVDPDDVAVMEQVVPIAFVGHVVTDVTHLLRTDPGAPSLRTYKRQVHRPVATTVLDLVAGWITDHVQTTNGADHEPV